MNMRQKSFPHHPRNPFGDDSIWSKPESAPEDHTRTLAALRRDMGFSQQQMAERLGVRQAAISKMENRGDLHLSSLKKYCQALGGDLELTVAFHNEAGTRHPPTHPRLTLEIPTDHG